ncbi:tRNA(Met) cytidine acetyltransferase [Candidatus Bathyarchaeota archaeon]|nr:tRNA(Met) cytidine acetyltransferase [Candidatus Bathyarchaeota archaeon]
MGKGGLEVDRALTVMMEEALKAFHRRLLVIYGEGSIDLLAHIVWRHREFIGVRGHRVIYVDPYEEGGPQFKVFLEKLGEKQYPPEKVRHYSYDESNRLLGTTNDILILDMSVGARPNDLGRLVETVSGGGLVILHNLDLNFDKPWDTTVHRKLIHPPYDLEDLKPRFEKYFVRKTLENPSVWIFDGWKVVKGGALHPKETDRGKPRIPEKTGASKKLYRLTLTQDQAEALQVVENAMKERGRNVVVITSNRGRGKSALLGLSAALLLHLGARKVLVTAPGREEVQTVFEMAEKGLTAMKEKVRKEFKDCWISRLRCDRGVIEFKLPYRALSEGGEIVLVDEAAGIHVPLLFKLVERFPKIIFASTVHGYEGAGRGFSIRFLKSLEEEKNISLYRVELKEPIRYAPNDPVEGWLYDVLLLDAEPAEIRGFIETEKCRYLKPDLDFWFEKAEEKLREFVGIYVLAHYRNRPNDLLILADAPHHLARAVVTDEDDIAVALHLAEEGEMSEDLVEQTLRGKPPSGNLIPACIVRYYTPFKDFVKTKGIRVVRIATHPKLMGQGLGSLALEKLCEEAREGNFDWVGASFGADEKLLRFWLKNGFIPIHISPMRNFISGEFSVIVVKPLTREVEESIRKIHREFKLRLLGSLSDTYFNLEPQVAVYLLRSQPWDDRENLTLTPSQRSRLTEYAEGSLAYESACDAVKLLLKTHFLSSGRARMNLGIEAEAKLIVRCLQSRSWEKTAELLGIRPVGLKSEMRDHVRKLVEHYES